MNPPARPSTPKSPEPVSGQSARKVEIRADDFEQSGLYLLFPGGRRIALTLEKIDDFARTFETTLDQIPAEIRDAVAFQPCPVCPEKDSALFCHALPPTLAFFEELKGLKSFDNVDAVYRGRDPGLILAFNTTMQEALQFVAILSLMYYCEVGRQYRKYFMGVHPLMKSKEMLARIHLNIFWDCKGDKQKINNLLQTIGNEITCTCRCQVNRLRLICKDDALMNAFVNTQTQIELLLVTKDALLEQAFEDFAKRT
jgi:hypothetical protein